MNSGDLDLGTASGRLARMLTAVAVSESEKKGERVKSARRQEAMAGRSHASLGYGYAADRSINVAEAKVIREIARRLLSGETLDSVATGRQRSRTNSWCQHLVFRHVAKERDKEGANPAFVAFVDACRSEARYDRQVLVLLRRSGRR